MESSSGRVGTNVHLTIASSGACCARTEGKVEEMCVPVATRANAGAVVFPGLYVEGTRCVG
jgi:hypothetical protein